MTERADSLDASPQWMEVAGRRLRYRVRGSGPVAVVMVHGFGGRLEHWSANQAALAAGGRTVAALDLPGHGESSLDVGSGSLDELASCVAAWKDALGLARVHLVGHSMGAAVCLVLADRDPARVASVTLLGPAGLGQKINADFIRGYIAARSEDELRPLLRLLFADPARIPSEYVEQALSHRRREGAVDALMKIASSRYGGTPSGRALREVAGTVPTLVIWGALDAVIPAPSPDEFNRPGIAFHVLPGSGHMVQVEASAEVNALIAEFLR